jgi:hypothetical protein
MHGILQTKSCDPLSQLSISHTRVSDFTRYHSNRGVSFSFRRVMQIWRSQRGYISIDFFSYDHLFRLSPADTTDNPPVCQRRVGATVSFSATFFGLSQTSRNSVGFLFLNWIAINPNSRHTEKLRHCVCLLQQYLVQSCARGERRIVEDMCYEIQRAEACVD